MLQIFYKNNRYVVGKFIKMVGGLHVQGGQRRQRGWAVSKRERAAWCLIMEAYFSYIPSSSFLCK
jgi:hypothetical protein